MIDPHVHLRDFEESHKETVSHGLAVAYRAGLDAVFEMPNTNPPLVSRQTIERRIALADNAAVPIFHGIFGGLTSDPAQITNMVSAHRELFPRVVGLKLYAGVSTGSLAITDTGMQERVFSVLADAGYTGVLAVHCERVELFNPSAAATGEAFSHTLARPPESETESVRTIIGLAENHVFRGTIHICHVSVPKSVRVVEQARDRGKIKITCGITPHHALLDADLMKTPHGHLLKMNPPLRPKAMQEEMLQLLLGGRIDWIETDHAPHTIEEKKTASGIPVLPFYPRFIRILREQGMSASMLSDITHHSIERTFGIDIPESGRIPETGLAGEYPFDPFASINS